MDALDSVQQQEKQLKMKPQQRCCQSACTLENNGLTMPVSVKVKISGRSKDEDFDDQGLLASVDPENIDEIRRLLNLVDRRLHNAVQEENLPALTDLLDAGASLAAFDWAGRTPLHLCIVRKLIKPFEILLRCRHSVNVKDANGMSVLQVAVLHRWVEGVRAALEAGADVTYVSPYIPESVVKRRYESVNLLLFGARFSEETIVHLAVKSGDTDIIEIISSKAEMRGFIDCLNGKGVTALYTAIDMGDLEAVQILLKKGASVNTVSDRNDTALHIAVRKPNILKYLLENTEVVNYQNDYGSGPIHIAVSCNELESVKLLLDANHVLKRNSEMANKRKILMKPNSMGTNKYKGSSSFHHRPPKKWHKMLTFILCMPEPEGSLFQRCSSKGFKYRFQESPVIQSDNNGYTALHIAAKQRNLTMMILLLRKGAKLLSKGPKGRSALEVVAAEFYNPTECLELIFDEFINTRQVLSDTVVDVDYRALTNVNKVSQIEVLEELVKWGQKKILVHPLIESLLYLKWNQVLPMFYVMVAVYATFIITLNVFVINVIYSRDIYNSSFYTSPENNGETVLFYMFDGTFWILLIIIYTSIFLLFVQELLYIQQHKLRYFGNLESWVKLCGLTLATAVPPAVSCEPLTVWPRHIASAALLLGWLQAMLLLSRFPTWGHYALIFGKVATNLFKILITSIFLVIGFSFCFMIQYHSHPPFDGPFAAFVKTLVMMASEFDYEDLFDEDHDKDIQEARTFVRLCFAMFVIFVAIVLMNFMIGIAVSDVSDLQVVGNIRRLEKQVQLLSTLEVIVNESILGKMYKKKFGDRCYYKKISNFIGYQTKWKVDFKNKDGNGCHYLELPSALHKAIVEIGWRRKQREENDIKNNENKYKLSALYHAVVHSPTTTDFETREINLKTAENVKCKLQEQLESMEQIMLQLNQKVTKIHKLSLDIANMKVVLANLPSDNKSKKSSNVIQATSWASRTRSSSQ